MEDVLKIDTLSMEEERESVKDDVLKIKELLKDIDGIAFCRLTEKDVVRHPLVQTIVKAYEAYESKLNQTKDKRRTKKWQKVHFGRISKNLLHRVM